MPSDKSILCFGQNPSWGHWEKQTLFVHPGMKLTLPVEIKTEIPFEIHIGSGSCFKFIDAGHTFTCHLEQNAYLYHLGTVHKAHFILGADATLIHRNIVHAPKNKTSELQVELTQPKARLDWHEGVCLQQKECYQTTIKIEHFAPLTHSECCLKVIVKDNSNFNFTCDGYVYKEATKCTIHQKNLNHILSPQGHVTALPRLHIFNKHVEASHGTATQPVPQEALFYLQTRGLSAQQSEQLYLESFLQDCYSDYNAYNNGK